MIIIVLILGFIGIVITLGFIVAIGSEIEQGSKSRKKHRSSSSNESAQDISDAVTSLSKFRSLERKLDRADEKRLVPSAYDARSLKAEDRIEEKYQTLQNAYDIACQKTLRWQFIPHYDAETKLRILRNAYKIYSLEEYDESFSALGGDRDEWYGLRGDEEAQEKESEIQFLLKFRTIVEDDDLSKEDKVKKINSLSSRNKEAAEYYLDLDGDEKPGDQWFSDHA